MHLPSLHLPARFRRAPRPTASPQEPDANMARWAKWELRFIYVTSTLVMAASFMHVVRAFARIEGTGYASIAAGVMAALAIDASILMLTRASAHSVAAGKSVRPLLVAIGFLVVLSILGNLDEGFGVTIQRVAGQAPDATASQTTGLYALADLQALDPLTVARIVVFRGSLPLIMIVLSFAAVTVAANLAKVAPVAAAQTPPLTVVQPTPHTFTTGSTSSPAQPARQAPSRPAQPARQAHPSATPVTVTARRRQIVESLIKTPANMPSLVALTGAGESTLWRDIEALRGDGYVEPKAPDGLFRASPAGRRWVGQTAPGGPPAPVPAQAAPSAAPAASAPPAPSQAPQTGVGGFGVLSADQVGAP